MEYIVADIKWIEISESVISQFRALAQINECCYVILHNYFKYESVVIKLRTNYHEIRYQIKILSPSCG